MGLFNFFRPKSYSETLMEQNSAQLPPSDGELMVIEEIYRITGRGTIVTGKARAPIHKGQSVIVHSASGDIHAKVTESKAHHRSADAVQPGDPIAILLADVDRSRLQRGDKVFSA